MTELFLEQLTQAGGRVETAADGRAVLDFGDPQAEIAAIGQPAVVVPLTGFIRLVAKGRDRARFLHNFCTNNIIALASGQSVEAFFVDVKAHILGHGFVRADEESHEVWAFPGDEDVLLPHLDRYIITEDVTLESASAETAAFAVLGEPAGSSIDGVLMVRTVWDGIPVTLIAAAAEDAGSVWEQLLSQGCQPAGMTAFHHLRVRERFPLIGQDLARDHLAPEADRNDKAISYTKGCYLGQEPIARLDAMGHVNRALRTLRIDVPAEEIAGASLTAEGNTELGRITSAAAAATPDQSIALAVLKLRNVDLTARLSVVKDGGQLGHAEVV